MIQLCRNNLIMMKYSALMRPADFSYLYLSVHFKDDIQYYLLMLNWQPAERSAIIGTQTSSNHNYVYPCLLESSYFEIWQQLGISASCPFRVKFTSNFFGLVFSQCNNFNNIFSHVTQFKNSLTGLSLFRIIIQGVQLIRKAEFTLTQLGSSTKQ